MGTIYTTYPTGKLISGNVEITNDIGSAITISGSVSVSGTPSASISGTPSVSISGTPTVGLSSSSNIVKTDTSNNLLVVKRNAYAYSSQLFFPTSNVTQTILPGIAMPFTRYRIFILEVNTHDGPAASRVQIGTNGTTLPLFSLRNAANGAFSKTVNFGRTGILLGWGDPLELNVAGGYTSGIAVNVYYIAET